MTIQAFATRIDPAAREVLDELEAHVQCCLGSQIRDFRVRCQACGLVLTGHTHTYYAKQLAQQAVMEASDLPIVANDIEVS